MPEDHADKHNCAAVRESEESNDRSEEWSTDPEIEESGINRMSISQMPISPHFYKFTAVMFQSAPNLIKTPPSAWTLPPTKVTTTKIYTICVVSSNQDAKTKIPSKPTSSWSQNLSTLLLGKPTISLDRHLCIIEAGHGQKTGLTHTTGQGAKCHLSCWRW